MSSGQDRDEHEAPLGECAEAAAAARTDFDASVSDFTVFDLRTEGRSNPLGLDTARPRLSWKARSSARGTRQSAYQIQVTRGDELCWDTGKVVSDQSIHIPYDGAAVQSRQRYVWRVRIWAGAAEASPWSAPSSWEMGLLRGEDWTARWISPQIESSPQISTPAPLLRSEFALDKAISKARAYITSLGFYELHLNGRRVGDALFTPGWTSFEKRLQYQVHDVTALLKAGPNAIGVILGDGRYRFQPYNRDGHRNNGKAFALLVQIEVIYQDGSAQTVVSNDTWRASTGPILRSEIYSGETYDARLEQHGWTQAGFEDSHWAPVALAAAPRANLIAAIAPPVRRIEEIRPIRISKRDSGAYIVDMGQNLAGFVRLRAEGKPGTCITLRHAEVLDQDGDLYLDSLRGAEQRVEYVLGGNRPEVFEPHFTFQGFRYVEVENYPGELSADSIAGVVVHSDMEPTGVLETSDPMLNQLLKNIVWSLKGNFIDVPTDCPQRNERLGWGFDAMIFTPTAALNMDVSAILAKWLADHAADQWSDGALPMEAPRSNRKKYVLSDLLASAGRQGGDDRIVEFMGVPGYGDAATIIPWHIYLAYGDIGVLAVQYETMKRWVEYERAQSKDHIWNPVLSLGDWLDFNTTREPIWFGSNAFDLMATAFYAHSVELVRRTARLLEEVEDAARYGALRRDVVAAFNKEFVSSDGRVGDGAQVNYVLALDLDLLPEPLRPAAAAHLADDVRTKGHLTTGIGGTQHLLNVLTRFGYIDEAYRLLMRREMPSWLYQVENGATTIWERWDSLREDGSFQDPGMNSFNHYALGAIGEWMYGVIGGIALDPASPGYKHVLIQPRPGGGLEHARAWHRTPYGDVSASWRLAGGHFHLDVELPPNTSATVMLPSAQVGDITEGAAPLAIGPGIMSARQAGADALIEIGSGAYAFSVPLGQQGDSPDRRDARERL